MLSHPKDKSEMKEAVAVKTQTVFKNQNEIKALTGVPSILSTALQARTELFNLQSGTTLNHMNKALHTLFQPKISEVGIPQFIEPLLNHVIRGEQKEAEALLQNHPGLVSAGILLKKGKVTDYSGRVIEGTALQLALGAEDFGIQKNEEGMVEMLVRYLKTLPKGEDKITEQCTAQFPEDKEYQEQEEKKNAEDIKELEKVIAAIDANPGNCEEALQAFRSYLAPQKQTITRGKHFNANLLLEAYRLYDKNLKRFGDYSLKNSLCWCKVIGYIQRYLPACYGQAFSQGLTYIFDKKEQLNRSLQLRYDPRNLQLWHNHDTYFFPLDLLPRDPLRHAGRLGYDHAVWASGNPRPADFAWGGDDNFPHLCKVKTAALKKFMRQFRLGHQNKCTIM